MRQFTMVRLVQRLSLMAEHAFGPHGAVMAHAPVVPDEWTPLHSKVW